MRGRDDRNSSDQTVLKIGNIALDLWTRKVKVGDRIAELPAREFTLAETFLRHQTQNLPMFESCQKCDIFLENNRRLAEIVYS